MIDERLQPYETAVLLANLGFTLTALGDFDRALARTHQGAEALHAGWRRRRARHRTRRARAVCISAWATRERSLETLRAAIVAQEHVVGFARPGEHVSRRRQRMRGTGTPFGCTGLPAQIGANRCESAQRGSYQRADRGELRVTGDLAAAESELLTHCRVEQFTGAGECARRARTSAPRKEKCRPRHRGSCGRRSAVRGSRSRIQSDRSQHHAVPRLCSARTTWPERRSTADEAHRDRTAYPGEVGQPGVACAIPLLPIFTIRSTHRGRTSRARPRQRRRRGKLSARGEVRARSLASNSPSTPTTRELAPRTP